MSTPAMSAPLLEVRKLVKRFGAKTVLDRVSFSLPPGAVMGIVGPNGAGKTTLFSIIAGYLQADAGDVLVEGTPLGDAQGWAGRLGILPQDALFPRHLKIEQVLHWYARSAGYRDAAAWREVWRVLALVNMIDAASARSSELSHGMHKRVAIAQALIGSPPLIILDEPTAGLDPRHAAQLRELIRRLAGQRALLVSSHNLDEIGDLCDHITVLDHGQLVHTGTVAQLVEREAQLNFVVDQRPPDTFLDALRMVDGVLNVQLGADGRRLTCVVTANFDSDPSILHRVLDTMSTHRVDFSQLIKGQRLEDAFLQLTAPPTH